MVETATQAIKRYDDAAPRWGDKMRTLGYYDAYLGFLSEPAAFVLSKERVIDVGAGTGAFAEAWIAVHGAPSELTLLEPSSVMLTRARAALDRRGVEPRIAQSILGETELEPSDVVLAAHVIEHCPDPLNALRQMRDLLVPGGQLRLVVSKPHWCNVIIWLQWRHRTFQRDEIVTLVEQAGFDIDQVYSFPSGPPSRTSRGIAATRRN